MTKEAIIVLSITAVYLLYLLIRVLRGRSVKRRVRALARNAVEMSPEAFFRLRNKTQGNSREHISKKYDYEGVYILYNKTRHMYYVGQALNVLSRINQHLTGHGNGDVYADFKYGDRFSITSIRLRGSGHATLNELERHCIAQYKADSTGYNKTRGNKD
ncbi:MAG: GIY-YIG nuclease family protein [Oscillospiraceae bacterium]|nr:GIY-YIG nuclease family protein [Oscillospiraceae bacterium]MBR6207741.1 GIY-YIG nuclease family protein [Oscillospiraceae bacterium]